MYTYLIRIGYGQSFIKKKCRGYSSLTWGFLTQNFLQQPHSPGSEIKMIGNH